MKLWRKPVNGHAPLSFRAGGQLRSRYPAPTDSFSIALDLSAEITRPQRLSLLLECPAPRSMLASPSGIEASAITTKR